MVLMKNHDRNVTFTYISKLIFIVSFGKDNPNAKGQAFVTAFLFLTHVIITVNVQSFSFVFNLFPYININLKRY